MSTANYQALRLILADDQLVVRDCVKAILEDQGLEIVGMACDGGEAVHLCRDLKPDIAVLDISMPRLNGICAARAIKRVSPATKIILLTTHLDEGYVSEGLRAGASAYVLKNEILPALLHAIFAAMRGETYLSPRVVRSVGAVLTSPAFPPTP